MAENRIRVCPIPECGGKLGSDKSAVVAESGYIYRVRVCEACGAEIRTKQGPEEVCPCAYP